MNLRNLGSLVKTTLSSLNSLYSLKKLGYYHHNTPVDHIKRCAHLIYNIKAAAQSRKGGTKATTIHNNGNDAPRCAYNKECPRQRHDYLREPHHKGCAEEQGPKQRSENKDKKHHHTSSSKPLLMAHSRLVFGSCALAVA